MFYIFIFQNLFMIPVVKQIEHLSFLNLVDDEENDQAVGHSLKQCTNVLSDS